MGAFSTVDPGYRSEQVLTATLDVPEERYWGQAEAVAFYESLLARVRTLPGVSSRGSDPSRTALDSARAK